MRTLSIERSVLLVIDIQSRLMPAIYDGELVVKNARRLMQAASLLGVPGLATEQNPKGLGPTVDALPAPADLVTKMTFDAAREPGLLAKIDPDRDVVALGCEAHVCVLQTVLGLLDAKRRVFVVSDAVGSRDPANREAALRRMERHGGELVTTEMVVFEWLGTAEHPKFRDAVALIR